MLQEFTDWFLSLVVEFFADLWEFVLDVLIEAFDLLISAIVGLVSLVPVPLFMSSGLQSIFVNIDPGIVYFVSVFRIPEVLAMFGAAYLFRIGRKVVTLFQW